MMSTAAGLLFLVAWLCGPEGLLRRRSAVVEAPYPAP